MAGTRPRASRLVLYAYLVGLAVFAVGPLLLTWVTAFKTTLQVVQDPFALPDPFTMENVTRAWNLARFDRYFINSVLISLGACIGVILTSSLAGYALARMEFVGKRAVTLLFLIGLTIPVTAIVLPLYLIMRDVRLLDTHASVVIAHVALATPIFTFIMRAFFRDLPKELDDAARVDGCGEVGVFGRVMLPLARPGLLTVALLELLWSWNALLLPLVFLTTDSLRTLPVGLLLFQGRGTADWGAMSAGVLLMSLPVVVLFLLFQRNFVAGLTSGSVKG